jgi:sec-independent protein translocase protein TatA
MGGFSLIHWLVLGLVVLLLFGRGRFSDMMGDVAKGLKSFKKGMAEDDDHPAPQARLQNQQPLEPNRSEQLQPMRDDRPSA